ncbi:hypothetical protein [Paenochrobactrum pullorum]|uniref:hypothetical protein n=1 Tax=Paenochrobactrum pullorum TaxID=1324351 RepID=UPI0035BC5C51
MKKTQVYNKESGHLGQYEEWWYLIEHDDGTQQIEHRWHNVRVNGLKVDEGSKIYSLADGLKEAPFSASDQIRNILGI